MSYDSGLKLLGPPLIHVNLSRIETESFAAGSRGVT